MPKSYNERWEEKKVTHPAFGVVSFHRVTGGHQPLFQSDVQNYQTVRLTISTAILRHDLAHDSVFKDKDLIEVELSPAQFAELLTTMNTGPGTPCTIRYVQGKEVERLEEQKTETYRIQEEFKKDMKGLASSLKAKQAEITSSAYGGVRTYRSGMHVSVSLRKLN